MEEQNRSSHRRCSIEKVFLEILQNSRKNTSVRASFFNKLQVEPSSLLKKRLWHRCFPVNLAKFLRTPLLTEHLRWLLLLILNIEKFYHFKSLISENQKKKNVITHKISHKTVKMQISNMKPNKTKSPLLYIMLNQDDIISYEAYFIKGNNTLLQNHTKWTE